MKKALILVALALSLSVPVQPVMAAELPFTIIAGDVLQITVWKEEGMDREVVVLPNGDITFPLVGTVNVQGFTPEDVQDVIKDKLKNYIPDASVAVSVKAALGHTVNVVGQVGRPGEIIINRRMTTLQALSQAGGLTPFADEDDIIVIRRRGNQNISIPVPYGDIVSGHKLDRDITLEPGDVIVVPTASLF
ncbi:MAG: polysaccharide biosynthesis/export family protein [Bdellovibrionales bacterium]|jgi:polysaccharide export outer membrane protein